MLFRSEITTALSTTSGEKPEGIVETTRYADRRRMVLSEDMLLEPIIVEIRDRWAQMTKMTTLPMTIVKSTGKENAKDAASDDATNEKTFANYNEFYSSIMENSKKGIYIQRYKGLGEMNPEQLWETTLNPENRNLLRVRVQDAVSADETFSILMGEQVEPRRKFIQDNALLVGSLDV